MLAESEPERNGHNISARWLQKGEQSPAESGQQSTASGTRQFKLVCNCVADDPAGLGADRKLRWQPAEQASTRRLRHGAYLDLQIDEVHEKARNANKVAEGSKNRCRNNRLTEKG